MNPDWTARSGGQDPLPLCFQQRFFFSLSRGFFFEGGFRAWTRRWRVVTLFGDDEGLL